MTIAMLMLIFAVVAGSAGMVAVLGWIIHRISRLEGGNPAALDHLLSKQEDLHDELEAMRAQLRAMDERIDFSERLLEARPRELPGSGPDEDAGP